MEIVMVSNLKEKSCQYLFFILFNILLYLAIVLFC